MAPHDEATMPGSRAEARVDHVRRGAIELHVHESVRRPAGRFDIAQSTGKDKSTSFHLPWRTCHSIAFQPLPLPPTTGIGRCKVPEIWRYYSQPGCVNSPFHDKPAQSGRGRV